MATGRGKNPGTAPQTMTARTGLGGLCDLLTKQRPIPPMSRPMLPQIPSKSTAFASAVMIAMAAAAGPVAAASDLTPDAEQITQYRLENDMQVVVIEDHRAPLVVHMVWYRSGAADEPAGKSGVAHLLEHLLFKGTEAYPGDAFSTLVMANGGQHNAATAFDYTSYFQMVAADKLELMMQLESDRMVNLRLDAADIVGERPIVLQERSESIDSSPAALLYEQMDAAQFLNHPYGIPVVGWRHEIEQLSRADVLAYYRRYYAPNNAVLVVAGDVVPAEVKTMAETYYGSLAPSSDLPPRLRPLEPPQNAARRILYRDARVAQPQITRSYLAPARAAGDQRTAAALSLLSYLLGDGPNSILATRLQFESSLAVYAQAFYNGVSVDDTTFDLVVIPAPGVDMQQLEDAMDAALRDVMTHGIAPDHLERLKSRARAAQIYGRDSASDRARAYGRALTAGLRVEDVQAWPALLQSISEAEILAAAQNVLVPRGSVTGWLLPAEPAQ